MPRGAKPTHPGEMKTVQSKSGKTLYYQAGRSEKTGKLVWKRTVAPGSRVDPRSLRVPEGLHLDGDHKQVITHAARRELKDIERVLGRQTALNALVRSELANQSLGLRKVTLGEVDSVIYDQAHMGDPTWGAYGDVDYYLRQPGVTTKSKAARAEYRTKYPRRYKVKDAAGNVIGHSHKKPPLTEAQLAGLAKGRATRAKNLRKKKKAQASGIVLGDSSDEDSLEWDLPVPNRPPPPIPRQKAATSSASWFDAGEDDPFA